jgi:hypothetical protein
MVSARYAGLAAACVTALAVGLAQDTKYAPVRQQIPPPECMAARGLWAGGYTPCDESAHQQWYGPGA